MKAKDTLIDIINRLERREPRVSQLLYQSERDLLHLALAGHCSTCFQISGSMQKEDTKWFEWSEVDHRALFCGALEAVEIIILQT